MVANCITYVLSAAAQTLKTILWACACVWALPSTGCQHKAPVLRKLPSFLFQKQRHANEFKEHLLRPELRCVEGKAGGMWQDTVLLSPLAMAIVRPISRSAEEITFMA